MLPKSNEISAFRRYSPQVLACFAKNMLLLNFTLGTNLSTIIIAALKGLNQKNNPNEFISITSVEESWIATLFPLFVVFGNLLTGFLEPLGRKKSIILCNIPFFICWIYLYYSNSVFDIYITLAVLGFFSGLSEAPVLNYIGEISEPSIRAILSSTTNLTFEIGAAIDYLLGNLMPWRSAVLIYTSVPVIGVITMLFVPETPQWLLSHNRKSDALKSLQWFRGWAKPNDVSLEFHDLERYRTIAYVCYECEKNNVECKHPQPTMFERLRELLRRKTWFPCLLIIILQFNALIGGLNLRPFAVPILSYFKTPLEPNTVLMWLGCIGLIANFLTMICIRSAGKRKIYLISLGFVIIILYAIGAYGFMFLNGNGNVNVDQSSLRYFPVYGFATIFFLNTFGVRTIPNLLISEILPYRSKGVAAGFTLAVYYINSSVSSKTFHTLQEALTFPGQCLFYATIAFVGFVVVYMILPETEGRTLEEIEVYFSDKSRKFNDIKIRNVHDLEQTTIKSIDSRF